LLENHTADVHDCVIHQTDRQTDRQKVVCNETHGLLMHVT